MPLPRRLKILVRICDVSLIVRRCRLWLEGLDGISSCLFSESTNAGSPLLHCRHATLVAVKLPFIFLLLRLPLDPQRNRACIICNFSQTRHLYETWLLCALSGLDAVGCMVPAACHQLQLVKFPQPCLCYLLFHSNNSHFIHSRNASLGKWKWCIIHLLDSAVPHIDFFPVCLWRTRIACNMGLRIHVNWFCI